MDWKPDADTLKSWGTSEQWPDRYFEWLRDKRPLPSPPQGPIENQHRMYQPLVRMLRSMENAEEETLVAFWDGRFKTFLHFECHDVEGERHARQQEDRDNCYRALVEEMLGYTGRVDERMVALYIARIDAARPYAGPMG